MPVSESCSGVARLMMSFQTDKLLALKAHPDKNDGSSEANAFFVRLTEAYSVLKNDKTRREFVEELRFFRTHGRVRWTMRYRLYPRTNVYVVIIATILVSVAMQMYLKWWWHKRMYAAARNTDLYQARKKKKKKKKRSQINSVGNSFFCRRSLRGGLQRGWIRMCQLKSRAQKRQFGVICGRFSSF